MLEIKSSKGFLFLLCCSIVFLFTYYDTSVLDQTLSNRYFLLNCIVFGSLIFFWKSFKNNPFYLNSFFFLGLAGIIYVVSVNFFSLNISLSFVASCKIITYFIAFILFYQINSLYKDVFLESLLKSLILLFYIIVIAICFQLLKIDEISREKLYEITAFSGHKNLLSITIFILFIFTCFYLIKANRKWKIISIITICVQVFLLLLLQTRTVWISFFIFIISLLSLLLIRNKIKEIRSLHVILSVLFLQICMNLFFLLIFPIEIEKYKNEIPYTENINQINDYGTLNERVLVWDKTYAFLKENLVFGVGGNNWQVYFPSKSLPKIYPVLDLNTTYQRPHNDFLWIFAEYGVIGLNLFFFVLFVILVFSFKVIINEKNNNLLLLIPGLLACLSCSFFDFPMERIELNVLFILLISIILTQMQNEFKSIQLKPSVFFTCTSIVAFFTLMISFKVFYGEKQVKKMQMANLEKNASDVIFYANKAKANFASLDPTSTPIDWLKGNAYASLRKLKFAHKSFLKANNAHPFHHYNLNDLATSYYIKKNQDSAIYYYKKALFINPRMDAAAINLSLLFIENNDWRKAKQVNDNMQHASEKRLLIKQMIDKEIK